MARGQVRIRLTGLGKARQRIKALSGRATDRSISKNFLRIGAPTTCASCHWTPRDCCARFRMQVLKRSYPDEVGRHQHRRGVGRLRQNPKRPRVNAGIR